MSHNFFKNNESTQKMSEPAQQVLNALAVNLLKVKKILAINPTPAGKSAADLLGSAIDKIPTVMSAVDLKQQLHASKEAAESPLADKSVEPDSTISGPSAR